MTTNFPIPKRLRIIISDLYNLLPYTNSINHRSDPIFFGGDIYPTFNERLPCKSL